MSYEPANENHQQSLAGENFQEVKILIVDDDADSREIISFILEDYGAQVTVAASAKEALDYILESKPNLILSDLGMPDIDGYSLIGQIRALPSEQGGDIPAIALTAYATDEDHDRAIASGFQYYLTKPINPDELLITVLKICQTKLSK
jgi:CheY-like chemotaxis protein